jgi:hypothetical protein
MGSGNEPVTWYPVTREAPLLPTLQAFVALYDGFIVAVLVSDGRIAATLASLCERPGVAPDRLALGMSHFPALARCGY